MYITYVLYIVATYQPQYQYKYWLERIASDKNNIHSDVDISAWTVTIIHTQQYQ